MLIIIKWMSTNIEELERDKELSKVSVLLTPKSSINKSSLFKTIYLSKILPVCQFSYTIYYIINPYLASI